MIVGLGIDLVVIDELEKNVEANRDRYLKRIFTDQEIAYARGTADPYQRLAARLAAKEAAMKALGTGWTDDIDWRNVEVVNDEMSGKPSLLFHGAAASHAERLGARRSLVSLTHTSNYAVAAVVLEG